MSDCVICDATVEHEQDRLPVDGELQWLCEEHWLAQYVLSMTHPEPPFVDVGLYQEAVFYARQLAACSLGQEPEGVVQQTAEDRTGETDG